VGRLAACVIASGAVALLGLGACDDPTAPYLHGISPAEARPGDRVVLSGERLCGTAVTVTAAGACEPLPAGRVSFGIDPMISGSVVTWQDRRIEAIVPGDAAGEVLVVVTVDGRSSNGISLRVR
jgi:hypothetical protein